MIATSQEWKNNQNKQIRAEGDVRLTFYKATGSGYTVDNILTKKDIQAFHYNEQGTIINETLPYASVSFSVFKGRGFDDIDTSGYCKLEIGYHLPTSPNADANGWEWITRSYLTIKNKSVPTNGLIATYELISCFNIGSGTHPYKSVETTYKDGSFAYRQQISYDYDYTRLAQKLNATFAPTKNNHKVGGKLPFVSYIELGRQLGIATGRTTKLSNSLFKLVDLTNTSIINGSIKKINCLNKPEKMIKNYGTKVKIACHSTYTQSTEYDTITFTLSQSQEYLDVEGGKYGLYFYGGEGSVDRIVANNQLYFYSTAGTTYSVKLYPMKDVVGYDISSFTPEELVSANNDDIVEIDCPLVKDGYDAGAQVLDSECKTYLHYGLSHNVFYEVECRIDPSFELFDLIALEMPDDTFVTGFIENIEFSYNGAFKGKIKIRKQNKMAFVALKNISSQTATIYISDETASGLSMEYATYQNMNWQTYTPNASGSYQQISVPAGETVFFRGNNPNGLSTSSRQVKIHSNQEFEVFGDIMSLIDNTGETTTIPNIYCFKHLFDGSPVKKVSKNFLSSAKTLTNYCFNYMFANCSHLVEAPDLPANSLRTYCYAYMFYNCSLLRQSPKIGATSLSVSCYDNMFARCSSLVNPPELPITTLQNYCYRNMFLGCTSLVNAPALPASTMKTGCYQGMFEGCTSLVDVRTLLNSATTVEQYCFRFMFAGCTSLAYPPYLPATVLANECYREMFSGCTSLTYPPQLPVTTLASRCCYKMFYNCTHLIYLIPLYARTLAVSCYESMFENCTRIEIFSTQGSGMTTYRIPINGEGTTATDAMTNMFKKTVGRGDVVTPIINTTYYTTNQIW